MTSTEQMLLDKYNTALLGTEQMAEVLNYKNSRSVLEAIRRDTFPIKTKLRGGKRVASVRVVAQYIDAE